MPLYQLQTSLALALVTVCSFGFLVLNRPVRGKLQLPVHLESHSTYDSDPFDVTKPDDLVHGYPTDESAFWAQMKRRKVVMCALICGLATIQAFLVLHGDNSDNGIEPSIIDLCYALYLLGVGITFVGQVERHAEFVWQLTVLTVFPAVLSIFAVILPDDANASTRESPILWLPRLILVLYVALAFSSINTPLGPPLHLPPSAIYSEETACAMESKENVTSVVGSSPWSRLYFSYVWKVVKLGNVTQSVEIADLPIIPVELRAVTNYDTLKRTLLNTTLAFWSWKPRPGSGATLAYQLLCANFFPLTAEATLTVCVALLTYAPPACLNKLVSYLESDPTRENTSRGWFWVVALFTANTMLSLARGQLWSLCSTNIKMQIRNQLNGVLFAKTLVKKDVASFSDPKGDEKRDFSSKAQIMTLMTADVGRVGNSTWYVFDVVGTFLPTLVQRNGAILYTDAPIEIFVAAYFLYQLLGVSSLVGLAATCFFTPLNHFASKVVVGTQSKLMKARDERIGLMNEVLGGIRMIKFMAWERNFEARVMNIREKELKYHRRTYTISVLWNALWTGSPILITVLSFWHFAVIRQQTLTPSIAFTAVILFNQLRFALSALPNSVIQILQVALSLARIEKYLGLAQVAPVPPIEHQSPDISFRSCTVTWAQDTPSAESRPNRFVLADLTLDFPRGELSLVCGALGSGKSLMLLALLGEADVVSGQITCPRSPADSLAYFSGGNINWLVEGMCAYVPQVAWLRNASVRDNILFHLPYEKERYEKTLEACALNQDLQILEDGDQSLVGERGLSLSGGQKARVSLARAIYSRASTLLLDDVLSAVDAHTAHHLYHSCLKGELVKGRTVILVSHHIQLCATGANYIVALNNGRVQFAGTRKEFQTSQVIKTLVQSTVGDVIRDKEEEASTMPSQSTAKIEEKKQARKVVEQEFRAVGRVARKVWATYLKACGGGGYWLAYLLIFVIAALSSVLENGWLSYWSGGKGSEDPAFYVMIYSILTIGGLVVTTSRWLVLYSGSIQASNVLYRRLLQAVLFADFRFHDTSSRGRLLNRFGKDFEGIDSGLSENIGYCTVFALATITSMMLLNFTGGFPFLLATIFIAIIFYSVTSIFVQTARDVQRLESVTQSPLYSMYSENIAGVAVIRAFGASSKILRDMLRAIDTNATAHYWTWGLTRWLSLRFELLAGGVMCTIAAVAISNTNLSAATAGLALSFSGTVASNLLYLVRRWVQVEQSMVALERVNEYCEIDQEPPEFMEPRPPSSWPSAGAIQCQDLVVRYAPELPAVLHGLTFNINAGEKIGILGRTGSGKSTLALSFLRFVSPSQGKITIDGIDISQVGLTDLRNKLSIIPQDPTILSGTLRSTLDVLGEYSDAEIFEALRRVHLIQSTGMTEVQGSVNPNLFCNLDSLISEGGDSLSAGEKQLLCMARAILKKSRILLMDEATASVDYATDELISRTIMEEFTSSTLLTVAHHIRSVINHDKIMVLDQGKIAEFDRPADLLRNPSSQFYALCKATGAEEFGTLRKLAGL